MSPSRRSAASRSVRSPPSAKLAIFDCPIGTFVCADTDTLAQAKAAGAIKQTAKLQDLGYYKDASGHDITAQGSRQGPAARHDARGSAGHRPAEDGLRLGGAAAPGLPAPGLLDRRRHGDVHRVRPAERRRAAGRQHDRRAHTAGRAIRPELDDPLRRARNNRRRADALVARERAHLARQRPGPRHELRAQLPSEARPQPGDRGGDGEDRSDRPRRNRQRSESSVHADHRAGRADERRSPEPRSRPSPTRSTSATPRAARTATTSRSRPLRASS